MAKTGPTLSARFEELFADSPLRHKTFRMFYAGSIAAALGYMMQATIAAWVMATLTPTPIMVALVQTASTAPALVIGLIAGTMADLVDRRKLILINMIILIVSTVLLGVLSLTELINPGLLLLLTFIVGAAFTFYMPAQSASVNEFVAREELARAIALNSVAYNVARAIGPALAGFIAALISSGSALVVSAAFFCVMIVSLRGWTAPERSIPGVPETLISGVLSGLRYSRHSIAMRTLIIRSVTFSICASALWALLPVIARDQLKLGAGGYGMLFTGFGIGAIVGALAVPHQLQKKSLNYVVSAGVVLWAFASFLIASTDITVLALLGTACAGMAWVSVHASISTGLQSSAPAWVRARAVAIGLISVQACLALGSVVWGAVATAGGTKIAMALSAGMMLLLHMLNRHVRIRMGSEADVTLGAKLPTLMLSDEPDPDDGPVLIQIEYRIEPDHRAEFLRLIQKVEWIRRRNGATSWRVFRDLGQEGVFVERYLLESWAEYMRLRGRMTLAERKLIDEIESHQKPDIPIRVSRLLGVNPRTAVSHVTGPSSI
jgi:MFS family permease